jgi:hypothetical protein
LVGRHVVGVDRRGRHVAAHQDLVDAEALRRGERRRGTAQVLGEGVLVDAFDVAKRLIKIQRQAQSARETANLLGAVVAGDDVWLEDLDPVETGVRTGVHLLGEGTADRNGGDGRLHVDLLSRLMYQTVT